MSEDVSRVPQPLGKKGNRLIAILSFLILITLITPAQAIDYDDGAKYISGWDVADSGTDADLFTSAYDGESVFAFGAGGVILQSADKGATWVQLESPATSNLRTSDSVEGAIAVVGDGGAAYLRADGSETWLDISLTPPVDFRGMAMTSATSLVAVGPSGAIWQYSSETWIQRDSGVSTDLNEVSFLDATSGMIVGDGGTILATDDGGESWEYREAPEGLDADIVALDYYSSIRVYAITDEGHIVKSVGTNSGTAAGYVWELVEIESAGRNTSLELELNSIDVSSVNKFLVSGPSSYTALSLDGGNIITSQINPLSGTKDFNHVLFLNLFDAVIVGADGVILFSENAGEDEAVGFFIIDYGDFGQFVDYSKEMLIDGLHATIRIVLFGMVLGFFLGIILSMMKTAPTTLKNVAQLDRFSIIRMILIPFCIIETTIPFIQLNKKSWSATRISERLRILSSTNTKPLNTLVLRAFGLGILYYGIMLIYTLIPIVRGLNLDGWEYVYTPIGLISPDGINGVLYFGNFLRALLGIALILLGLLFLTTRKFFLKREVILPFRGITVKWNFWDVRPMNAVATVYTDLFRNTPLLVQFLFIHFGVQFGKILGDPGAAMLEGETNFALVYIRDMILADRACVSSIFALGLNSGAYQCETIRGAIAAIPSGQMEAGRSIGLNYMQTMGLVIMPQAIRICIPPMGNEMVNLVLNSSLAMVVGYSELTRKGRLINAVTFQIFWAYGMVLVSYFVVTWTLALLLRRLETKSRIPGLGISGGT
jgi:ABC-type amino acid transport system permease subunit/photosystem II stability/assembly factor-like uncharacterized protein